MFKWLHNLLFRKTKKGKKCKPCFWFMFFSCFFVFKKMCSLYINNMCKKNTHGKYKKMSYGFFLVNRNKKIGGDKK